MISLFHADCLEKMKDIPDKSVDLVLTSPPYDNLRTYNDSLLWSFDIFKNIASALVHKLKPGGVIVWIVNDATINGSETGTSFKQALHFIDLGLNLHDTMIWQKFTAPKNHNRYEQQFEYMFILSKGRPRAFNGLRDKINSQAGVKAHISQRDKTGRTFKTSSYNKIVTAERGLRTNVWNINPCQGKIDRVGHPAPFPIALASDHVLSWSNELDTVLDPFLGSGTTGVACKNLNRSFIGIEKDETYFNIANKRIENAQMCIQESFL